MNNDTTKPIWYKNQSVCAQATSTPKSTLRRAKQLGCPGFAGNNQINWTEAAPWIQNNLNTLIESEKEYVSPRDRKYEIEIKILEKKYELLVEEEKKKSLAIMIRIAEQVYREMQLILTKEVPNKLQAMSSAQIETIMENEIVPRICKAVRELKDG